MFSFKYFKNRHHWHKVKIQSCKVMPLPETVFSSVACTSATNSLCKFIRRVSRNKGVRNKNRSELSAVLLAGATLRSPWFCFTDSLSVPVQVGSPQGFPPALWTFPPGVLSFSPPHLILFSPICSHPLCILSLGACLRFSLPSPLEMTPYFKLALPDFSDPYRF